MDAYNLAFPLVENKITKRYRKQSPWFTQGLIISKIKKSKLLADKHKNPTEDNIRKFKDYCKLHRKLRRVAKAKYYDEQIKQA